MHERRPRQAGSDGAAPHGRRPVAEAFEAAFAALLVAFAEAGYISQGGWWLVGAATVLAGCAWLLWAARAE
jgi:hypothetical protein